MIKQILCNEVEAYVKENPKSVLIGNKYYSGYYFYKDLIKND